MKLGKRIAVVVAVVCGAELVVAVMIGGAGLGVVLGWNGLVVAVAALTLAVGLIARRRGQSRSSIASARPMAPDAASAAISSES